MRKLVGLGFALAMTMATLGAPATAFHGSSWKAQGTALFAGVPTHAVAEWSGQVLGGGLGNLKLTFEVTPGVPLHQATIVVREDVSNVGFQGCWEIVDPYYMTGLAATGLFLLEGTMRNDLCSACFCEANSDYTAIYLGVVIMTLEVVGQKDTLADG